MNFFAAATRSIVKLDPTASSSSSTSSATAASPPAAAVAASPTCCLVPSFNMGESFTLDVSTTRSDHTSRGPASAPPPRRGSTIRRSRFPDPGLGGRSIVSPAHVHGAIRRHQPDDWDPTAHGAPCLDHSRCAALDLNSVYRFGLESATSRMISCQSDCLLYHPMLSFRIVRSLI
ncbi:hypothetical protein GW17_00029130 [Ensete ventricosum]|nr:hypothetical protein GW17_00029130 [Ensete ventricosum]